MVKNVIALHLKYHKENIKISIHDVQKYDINRILIYLDMQ